MLQFVQRKIIIPLGYPSRLCVHPAMYIRCNLSLIKQLSLNIIRGENTLQYWWHFGVLVWKERKKKLLVLWILFATWTLGIFGNTGHLVLLIFGIYIL